MCWELVVKHDVLVVTESHLECFASIQGIVSLMSPTQSHGWMLVADGVLRSNKTSQPTNPNQNNTSLKTIDMLVVLTSSVSFSTDGVDRVCGRTILHAMLCMRVQRGSHVMCRGLNVLQRFAQLTAV